MLDPKIENELKKAFRQNVLIYITMIGSMFVYAGVVEFLKRNTPQTGKVIDLSGSDANMFRNVLLVVAVLEYFIIHFIRNKSLSSKIKLVPVSGTKSPFSPPVRAILSVSIMTYGLCYTGVVYGFILFFLSHVTVNFYIFMVISLIFFALFRPQYSQWEGWMESR